jgi:hypothetical protein
VLIALVPLAFILFFVVTQGVRAINLDFFTHTPRPVGEAGGGMANASSSGCARAADDDDQRRTRGSRRIAAACGAFVWLWLCAFCVFCRVLRTLRVLRFPSWSRSQWDSALRASRALRSYRRGN